MARSGRRQAQATAVVVIAAAVSAAACTWSQAARVSSSGDSAAPWRLTWSDEFSGPGGAPVDPTRWVPDTGGAGWGNQELEYYTARRENLSLDGEGHLVITVLAEPSPASDRCWYGPCRFTSARIKTRGLFAQAYGRFEARIRIPRGQGIWPAFWMLGDDIDRVGWPTSGEIDVMENIGREPRVVHGTMHGPGYSGAGGIGGPDSSAHAFADDFHVYAVEWAPGEVRWLVDGTEYFRTTPASLPAGTRWVFDHPFFVVLNVAIGGGWPGAPDASTVLPQSMLVDYVRVYSR